MKIVVVGSREFKDITLIDGILDQLFGQFDENILVSGGLKVLIVLLKNIIKNLIGLINQ